jgi:dihydrolipoamide dehydrogenase
MANNSYDVVIIGGGPGGYVAAIRAAQLGMKVALIEKRKGLGGTCLNVGCIPSKALLDSSELYHQAKHKFAGHGIGVTDLKVDFPAMRKRKDKVVAQTVAGIDYLVKKNKIDRYNGLGSFVDAHTVKVTGDDNATLTAKNVIIATGSEPTPLPPVPFDGKRIISSTEALELADVPKKLGIVGAGAIGLEMGSVYARLGAEVTVIEYMDGLIPAMDKQLGRELLKVLKKLGMKFHLNTGVTGAKVTKKGVSVKAETKTGDVVALDCDYLLIAIGRRPYVDGLNLEAAGVTMTDRGRIRTNGELQTSQPHIWAIGDVIDGPMLAHKAEEDGVCAVERIAGQKPHLDYNLVPGVVYTWPEVSAVGRTEEQLKDAGISYRSGVFPFKASGRARAADDIDGFVKVLADAETDEVLGIHMIGPRCADLIAECVVAMEYRASAEDIGRICHPHPTFSEPIKEAALAASENRAIHI